MPRVRQAIPLFVIALPTLIYVTALLFDPSRMLVLWERGAPNLSQVWPLATGLIVYAALALAIASRIGETPPARVRTAALLAFVFVAGLLLQTAATRVVEPYPLRGAAIRQLSEFTGGYFTVGVRADNLYDFLSRYAQEMESFPVHPERHPPGLPLIFWFGAKLFAPFPALGGGVASWLRPLACFDDRAAQLNNAQIAGGLFGIVLETVVAWLTPVVLFFFVRRIANVRAAAFSALLYPLMPGALMWVSQWDRSFGLFVVAGLYLVERVLKLRMQNAELRKHFYILNSQFSIPAFALGFVLSVGVLMSFGNLPIVMLCGLYALARIWQTERLSNLRLRIGQGAVVLFGFLSLWLALIVFLQFDALGTYRTAMRIHLSLDRPFWPFVVWHPWDIFTFIGLPLVAIALTLTWRRFPALTFAWVATIVTLSLAHVARGETGRVWMYFAPVIVALAGMFLSEHGEAEQRIQNLSSPFLRFSVLILFVVQGIVHIGVLRVIGYGVDPATVADAAWPRDLIPTNIRFVQNGEMQLLGYTFKDQLQPGENANLDLYWKLDSTQPLSTSYKIFVHIADTLEDQSRIVTQDSKPMNWTLPTTCWRPGQIVRDAHAFQVDPNAQPGDYFVLIGLYDEYTNQRAFVHTAQVAMANAVALPRKVNVE